MNSKKKNARIAGILYLLIAITGGFGIMYTASNILVPGDATATANKTMSDLTTVWLTIACDVMLLFLL